MDVKSMLNESGATRPPRLHTPQSSYDARTERTPGSDVSSARPTLYGVNISSIDARVSSSDSYFASRSPHPNSGSASTPSTGYPAYAQSPGQYAHTPRDYPLAHVQHAPFVSPSPSHQPPTPGSAHLPQYNYPLPYSHSTLNPNHPFHSPPPPIPNGLPQNRHILPVYHPGLSTQPATPLGPPVGPPRASPQSQQRSSSQGNEIVHLRRNSQTSILSAHGPPSRENSYANVQPQRPEPTTKITPDPYPYGIRAREQSMEVSPKTIPRPSPYHEPVIPSEELIPTQASVIQSPKREPAIHSSPTGAITSPPPITQPQTNMAGSKRSASQMSDGVPTMAAPRKRIRRDDIPVWAQPAREKPRFVGGLNTLQTGARQPPGEHGANYVVRSDRTKSEMRSQQPPVNHIIDRVTTDSHVNGTEEKIMASIANIEPAEDLTRQITEWLAHQVLSDSTPTGGGIIEVEAKIGAIVDTDDVNHRICRDYPIMSETIFDRDKYDKNSGRRAKFQSSMSQHQHKILNQYLNSLNDEYHKAKTMNADPGRPPITYQHTRETDLFFELSEEGRRQLPTELLHWINKAHRREIKVRKTINETTGQVIASIIKTRLYDKDIFNPRFDFDYRISVSLEFPWQGPDQWLTPINMNGAHLINNNNTGRSKDRLSYRSQYYQVDLTQVHTSGGVQQKDHELEIEIDPVKIKEEFGQALRGEVSQYETLVRGLLDNVRLLSRKASL